MKIFQLISVLGLLIFITLPANAATLLDAPSRICHYTNEKIIRWITRFGSSAFALFKSASHIPPRWVIWPPTSRLLLMMGRSIQPSFGLWAAFPAALVKLPGLLLPPQMINRQALFVRLALLCFILPFVGETRIPVIMKIFYGEVNDILNALDYLSKLRLRRS